MEAGISRYVWQGTRDLAMGFGLFVVLFVGLCGDLTGGTLSASAASGIAQALALTSPAGPAADNALIAALLNRPTFTAELSRPSTVAVLAATFATMFAFNLAILRHLRRVYASPRRDGWGRGR